MDELVNVPEHRIVYCREIDPDSFLHMTAAGDRATFRRFDGTHPFEVDGSPDYSELKRCYRFSFDRPLTGEELVHSVEDEEYWSARMAELNRDLASVR